jgi:hypothetical protein
LCPKNYGLSLKEGSIEKNAREIGIGVTIIND